jgi:pyrroloquinoline quinone biosynthesis protein E
VAPLEFVGLSGGEPLLRNDVSQIARDIVNQGLGVVVITNGRLLTGDSVKRFPEATVFELTLFSADEQLHDRMAGTRGSFRKVLSAAAAINKNGRSLSVAIVVTKDNVNNIKSTIELAIAIGAGSILFNRVNLSRSNMQSARILTPSKRELENALGDADAASLKYNISIVISVPIPPCIIEISKYGNLHFGWCPRGGAESYYTIGYDGNVRPCNHSSKILGDLKTRSFEDIVESGSAKNFWRNIPDECKSCTMDSASKCLGGCPAASQECYGTTSHIDPFVDMIRCNSE